MSFLRLQRRLRQALALLALSRGTRIIIRRYRRLAWNYSLVLAKLNASQRKVEELTVALHAKLTALESRHAAPLPASGSQGINDCCFLYRTGCRVLYAPITGGVHDGAVREVFLNPDGSLRFSTVISEEEALESIQVLLEAAVIGACQKIH